MSTLISLAITLGWGALAALIPLALSRRRGIALHWQPSEEQDIPDGSQPFPLGLLLLAPILGLALLWGLGAAEQSVTGLLWGGLALAAIAVALAVIRWPDWL